MSLGKQDEGQQLENFKELLKNYPSSEQKILNFLKEGGKDFRYPDGSSFLHESISLSDASDGAISTDQLVTLLLKGGVDPNVQEKNYKYTLLHLVTETFAFYGGAESKKIIEDLVSADATDP